METVNWLKIKLSYKLEIFKLMYDAYKNILPDSSCHVEIFLVNEAIATRCEGTRYPPSVDKILSRFMKDSLAYRGSILWNLVNYNDKATNVSFKELKKRLAARDYFKDFIFDGTAVSMSRQSATMCTFKLITASFWINIPAFSFLLSIL